LIGRIWKLLGLQTQGRAAAINLSMFAGMTRQLPIQRSATVELQAGGI
jgi:hypothetical protein